jgi:hypothetical protein
MFNYVLYPLPYLAYLSIVKFAINIFFKMVSQQIAGYFYCQTEFEDNKEVPFPPHFQFSTLWWVF